MEDIKDNWKVWDQGLLDRRSSSFSEEERDHILKTFIPMWFSADPNYLVNQLSSPNESIVSLLWSLPWWFKQGEDRNIAYRILEQWEKMIDNKTNIMDVHFFYQNKWETYYKNRNFDDFALNKAINAFKKQIEISDESIKEFRNEYKNEPTLPTHKWYEQLAIIREKEWNYEEVIDLCRRAMKQWRWWDRQHRIDRAEKKITVTK